MIQRAGWTLLVHDRVFEQLRGLQARSECAAQRTTHSEGRETNANFGLFRPLSRLILETVPCDPSRDAYLPDDRRALMAANQPNLQPSKNR